MARKSLKDVQGVVAKQLAAISTAEQRELLRTPVHFIPLDLVAIATGLRSQIRNADRKSRIGVSYNDFVIYKSFPRI